MFTTHKRRAQRRSRRTLAIGAMLLTSLLATLMFSAGDAAAKGNDRETVWGHLESISTNANSGADPSMTFVARSSNGREGLPFGTFVYQTESGSKFVGKVDCYVRLDADTVAIGGDIVSTNVESWSDFGWTAWVSDGATSAQDWIRPTVGPAVDCEAHPWSSAGVPLSERWTVAKGQIRSR